MTKRRHAELYSVCLSGKIGLPLEITADLTWYTLSNWAHSQLQRRKNPAEQFRVACTQEMLFPDPHLLIYTPEALDPAPNSIYGPYYYNSQHSCYPHKCFIPSFHLVCFLVVPLLSLASSRIKTTCPKAVSVLSIHQ